MDYEIDIIFLHLLWLSLLQNVFTIKASDFMGFLSFFWHVVNKFMQIRLVEKNQKTILKCGKNEDEDLRL